MRSPVFRLSLATAALILPVLAFTSDAEAISSPQLYTNGKICRAEFRLPHMHAANGANADLMEAQIKAIRDWMRFTRFEYGRRWASWTLAMGHKMTCDFDGDAQVWRCRAEAQPCKN